MLAQFGSIVTKLYKVKHHSAVLNVTKNLMFRILIIISTFSIIESGFGRELGEDGLHEYSEVNFHLYFN